MNAVLRWLSLYTRYIHAQFQQNSGYNGSDRPFNSFFYLVSKRFFKILICFFLVEYDLFTLVLDAESVKLSIILLIRCVNCKKILGWLYWDHDGLDDSGCDPLGDLLNSIH